MTSPPANAVDLGKIGRDTNFQLLRAVAIEQYAGLEQALCRLFAYLLLSPIDRAAVVFFRMTNARSRNTILQTLLEKQFKDQYDLYWHGIIKNRNNVKGMFSFINQLDDLRNKIIHWNVVANIGFSADGRNTVTETLVAPNFYSMTPQSEHLTQDNLLSFCGRADFVLRSINMFTLMTNPTTQVPHEHRAPWLRIFQQQVIYPPSDNHPLSPNYKEPQTPPPPCGA